MLAGTVSRIIRRSFLLLRKNYQIFSEQQGKLRFLLKKFQTIKHN